MPNYPRTPGSERRTDESEWAQDAPFGHCPACGSIAAEDFAIPGDPQINFYCSDTTCRDNGGLRTMWGDHKPPELLSLERDGGSWNGKNFPGQILPEACPD